MVPQIRVPSGYSVEINQGRKRTTQPLKDWWIDVEMDSWIWERPSANIRIVQKGRFFSSEDAVYTPGGDVNDTLFVDLVNIELSPYDSTVPPPVQPLTLQLYEEDAFSYDYVVPAERFDHFGYLNVAILLPLEIYERRLTYANLGLKAGSPYKLEFPCPVPLPVAERPFFQGKGQCRYFLTQ